MHFPGKIIEISSVAILTAKLLISLYSRVKKLLGILKRVSHMKNKSAVSVDI